MKYLFQFGIIAAICFAAELLYELLPFPVPASVYGLLLLFFLLLMKIIKVEQVESVSDFFLSIMPILFISPSVSLLTAMDIIKGKEIALLFVALFSTVATMAVTGMVTQLVIRRRRKSEENKYE